MKLTVLAVLVLLATWVAAMGGAVSPQSGPLKEAKLKVGRGIAWLEYDAGMKAAKRQRKPVMIDFMASWCGWCKRLDAEVYSTADVIKLSRRFVCMKVDGDKRHELAQARRVEGYPTIVLLNAQGREVSRVVGYQPATEFLASMKEGLSKAATPSGTRTAPARKGSRVPHGSRRRR